MLELPASSEVLLRSPVFASGHRRDLACRLKRIERIGLSPFGRLCETLTWCVKALGHPPHKVAVRFQRSSLDILPGGRLVPVGNVRGDCSREHDWILRYQTNDIAPRFGREVPYIWVGEVNNTENNLVKGLP